MTIYNGIWTVVDDTYYEELYDLGYSSYATKKDYAQAVEHLSKVVEHDRDYKDGHAVYYLAQAYRMYGDLNAARPYYQYVIDNYPNTERATTAKKYVNAE